MLNIDMNLSQSAGKRWGGFGCVGESLSYNTASLEYWTRTGSSTSFLLKKNIAGFSPLKANHFLTSLFKFRFCFAGGSLDLKRKPYSPGTVTSDYFQWHFQLFPITIPGTRGERSHVLQHGGFLFSEQRTIYQTSAEKGTEPDLELCGRVIAEQICWSETWGQCLAGCWESCCRSCLVE